jgi:site-specific DNA-methyltransferase (adenine-specific)
LSGESNCKDTEYVDLGSAARFFYCAKASKSERNFGLPEGTTNKHPTVKPLSLIEYLIKLISVEGAVVLDPFMGSGTTGIACTRLGRKFVGYELDTDSFSISTTRLQCMKIKSQELQV